MDRVSDIKLTTGPDYQTMRARSSSDGVLQPPIAAITGGDNDQEKVGMWAEELHPLLLAAVNGDKNIVSIILEKQKSMYSEGGSDDVDASDFINQQSLNGETALYLACKKGHMDTARYLLTMGADPYVAPARQAAINHGHDGIVRMLDEFDVFCGKSEPGCDVRDFGRSSSGSHAYPSIRRVLVHSEKPPLPGRYPSKSRNKRLYSEYSDYSALHDTQNHQIPPKTDPAIALPRLELDFDIGAGSIPGDGSKISATRSLNIGASDSESMDELLKFELATKDGLAAGFSSSQVMADDPAIAGFDLDPQKQDRSPPRSRKKLEIDAGERWDDLDHPQDVFGHQNHHEQRKMSFSTPQMARLSLGSEMVADGHGHGGSGKVVGLRVSDVAMHDDMGTGMNSTGVYTPDIENESELSHLQHVTRTLRLASERVLKPKSDIESLADYRARKLNLWHLYCPLSHQLMFDPVVAVDGVTYERFALELWLQSHGTAPKNGEMMMMSDTFPNHYVSGQVMELRRQCELFSQRL